MRIKEKEQALTFTEGGKRGHTRRLGRGRLIPVKYWLWWIQASSDVHYWELGVVLDFYAIKL